MIDMAQRHKATLLQVLGCTLVMTSSVRATSLVPPIAGMVVGPQSGVSAPAGAVVLSPGADIASAVNAQPAGTTFYLNAGLYRTQEIAPKMGDVFIGAPGAILDGAKLLTGFVQKGTYWSVLGQSVSSDATVNGVCTAAFPRCANPQDVYFDGTPLKAVASLPTLTAGTFFFDYSANTVYVGSNPAGHAVELSYSPVAFGGSASNVTIRNLIVENYAVADQHAAISGGANWTVTNNDVRWNHGAGVIGGSGSVITGNLLEHNGQEGLAGGGGASGIKVIGNEIANNVWNGTDCGWECGGAKWGAVSNLLVQSNYVHGNQGDGLWTDVGSINVTYDSNRISGNLGAGISHEISGAATISNNVLSGNGATLFNWGWLAQIQIQNSSNTNVFGNQLILDPRLGGNGITIIQQYRGSYLTTNNSIHNNTITMTGGSGIVAGMFADYASSSLPTENNVFSGNVYNVPSVPGYYWESVYKTSYGPLIAVADWIQWRENGEDISGTAVQTGVQQ